MNSQDLGAALKKNKIGAGCAVLALACIVALFLRNTLIAEAETRLAEKSAEAQKYATNIQYSTQLNEQMETVTAAIKQIEARIIRASQLGINTAYFYTIESDTAAKMIDNRQLTPATVGKPAKGSYLPVAFSVGAQGDLKLILTFLQQIENGAHYCRVNSATLSGNPGARNSPLTLALSLELLGVP